MSQILAGSISLNQDAYNQFQSIYASFYEEDFVSLYAKFETVKGIITKVELRVINYSDDSDKKPYYIKSAKFIEVKKGNYFSKKRCPEISLDTTVNINCITLQVDIEKGFGNGQTSWRNRNQTTYSIEMPKIIIPSDKNNYLEVIRLSDELNESPQNLLNITKCYDPYKNNLEAAPGLICPRGYSRIFL